MTYEQIKNLREGEFKRLCGVKPKLFQEMVEVLQPQSSQTRQRGGQPKLSREEQLLIALEYWREYRTYFHIGQSWGVIEILADQGYQEIQKIHSNSYTSLKKTQNKSLSSTEKEYNRELARHRIYIEHVIRCLKIFRILAQPYRNRRRRFGLRFNLIASLYNQGLELAIT